MEFRRAAKVIALSAAMHGPILGGYAYHNSKPLQKAQLAVEDGYTALTNDLSSMLQYRERETLKRRAHDGEIGLGEFVIRANDIDERAKGGGFDAERSVADYNSRLLRFNDRRNRGEDPREALYSVTYDMDYHGGMGGVLGRDMLQKSLNCETIALLGAALAYDSGFEVDLRRYEKHLAAVITIDDEPYDPQRAGKPIMKGVPFAASSMISRYDSLRGGFAYPASDDGYPGWIPIFHKGAFESPYAMERAREKEEMGSDRSFKYDGDVGLPMIFYDTPPNYDYLEIKTASIAHDGNAFDFTMQGIADQWNLDVSMDDLSPRIIFATSSARFTSTSTPAEDAMWSGALVGMLQKVELYSAMIGKGQVSKEAHAQKMKALEEGRTSLSKIGDPAPAFLDEKLESSHGYSDPRLIVFLPPEGPRMLVKIAAKIAEHLGASQTQESYFHPMYSMVQYAKIPEIRGQVLAMIDTWPIRQKAYFSVIFDHTPHDGCVYDYCRMMDLLLRLGNAYGFEEAKSDVFSGGRYPKWEAIFENYHYHVAGILTGLHLGKEWERGIYIALDYDLHIVQELCAPPTKNEDCIRFNDFRRDMRKWVEENP